MNRNESFSAIDTHTVSFDMVRASIDVQSCDAEDIQLLISGDDDSVELLQIAWTNGRLSLSMPMRDRVPNLISPAWMQLLLRLPATWKGGMELKSQSGSISVSSFSGTDLVIGTVSGHIRVSDSQCMTAELRSMSGILLLQNASIDQLRLTTISGNILASPISFSVLTLSTVSGSSELNLTEPFRKISAKTVSGDTHLTVPLSEINASVTSVSGRLLTRNISIQESGPDLHLNTVTGHLEIVGDTPNLSNHQED